MIGARDGTRFRDADGMAKKIRKKRVVIRENHILYMNRLMICFKAKYEVP